MFFRQGPRTNLGETCQEAGIEAYCGHDVRIIMGKDRKAGDVDVFQFTPKMLKLLMHKKHSSHRQYTGIIEETMFFTSQVRYIKMTMTPSLVLCLQSSSILGNSIGEGEHL